ncbi:MAG: hypothetical protein ACFE96_18955 [Candidatus Hermodarchaeota archaeon]
MFNLGIGQINMAQSNIKSSSRQILIIIVSVIVIGMLTLPFWYDMLYFILPANVKINVHREGPEELLPLVESLESYVPTIIYNQYDYYDLFLTFNISEKLEHFKNVDHGIGYVNFNVTFDILDNEDNVSMSILDMTFNSSYWSHFDTYSSPYCWIYLSNETNDFHFQEIGNYSLYELQLNQYIQNFNSSLEEGEDFLYIRQELEISYYVGPLTAEYPELDRLILATTTGRVALMILIYGSYLVS